LANPCGAAKLLQEKLGSEKKNQTWRRLLKNKQSQQPNQRVRSLHLGLIVTERSLMLGVLKSPSLGDRMVRSLIASTIVLMEHHVRQRCLVACRLTAYQTVFLGCLRFAGMLLLVVPLGSQSRWLRILKRFTVGSRQCMRFSLESLL
jgi:hypothetical protein